MCRDLEGSPAGRGEEEAVEELRSLGIDVKGKSILLMTASDREELQVLVEILKQSMYQDYKTAYSRAGDRCQEEAYSTLR
jgi:hypothetical protein